MAAAPRPCPICGQPAAAAHRPFCSPRCRDIDLHRWLSGAYAIPAQADMEDEEDSAAGTGGTPEEDDPPPSRH